MTVIVGVDGSEHARKALEWAIEESRLRDETLWAVYAFPSAALPYHAEMFAAGGPEAMAAEARRTAREELDRALAKVSGQAEGVRVVPKTVEDPQPANVLTSLAAPGDVLVVGSRGRGGFKGLLLGSVSQQCVNHAPCPVVVVPAEPSVA